MLVGVDNQLVNAAVRQRGFLLYPGKLTAIPTFRVGCIGAIDAQTITQAVHAVQLAMQEMGMHGTQNPP